MRDPLKVFVDSVDDVAWMRIVRLGVWNDALTERLIRTDDDKIVLVTYEQDTLRLVLGQFALATAPGCTDTPMGGVSSSRPKNSLRF